MFPIIADGNREDLVRYWFENAALQGRRKGHTTSGVLFSAPFFAAQMQNGGKMYEMYEKIL